MTREIKFRAWLPSWEEMDYAHEKSDVEWSWCGNKFVLEIYHDDGFCGGMQEFENVKIMQYTGLTDKNGKEIYEGDYLEVKSLCFFGEDRNCRGVVDFLEFGFVVTDRKTFSNPLFVENCDIEILGNVFENPELI